MIAYRQYKQGPFFIGIGVLLLVVFGGAGLIVQLFSVLFSSFFTVLLTVGAAFLMYRLYMSGRFNQRMHAYVSQFSQERSQFVEQLIRLLTHAMKSDGVVSEKEKEVVFQFFQHTMGYDAQQMEWVRDLLTYALDNPVPLATLLQDCRQHNAESKRILLQLVYRVVFADGVRTRQESQFIDTVVNGLGLSDVEHDRIRALFDSAGKDDDHYYKVLGVSPTASKDEIKKAYRNLCKEYHPDKVHHLGDEFKKVAEEKMQHINEAYDKIGK